MNYEKVSEFDRPNGSLAWASWLTGLAIAAFWFVILLRTLNDPGLTVDESIYVPDGARMVRVLQQVPTQGLTPAAIDEIWRHAHEHPPLARLLLGLSHHCLSPAAKVENQVDPRLGRPVAAVGFALLVLLVTRYAWQLAGPLAGITAGMSLPLFPRLFGHAHLASLEILTSFFFFAGFMSAGWAFSLDGSSVGWWKRNGRLFIAAGFLGLALLVKLSNVLLLPAVGIALVLRQGSPGLWRFTFWCILGLGVFLLGWPWLWPVDLPGYPAGWFGSVERLREYLSTAFDRVTIYVWYFGSQYPKQDARVPWHYAWLYFFTTVPMGLQVVAVFIGLPRGWMLARHRFRALLLLITIGVTLGFFTLPVERYDGERLFLFVFPLWSVVVGIGVSGLFGFLARWVPSTFNYVLWAIFLVSQAIGIFRLHPCELSYYNALVGGLPGATNHGLEATYWGDSVTNGLLAELASRGKPGDQAALLPTMHAAQARFLNNEQIRNKNMTILPGDQLLKSDARWVIVYRRDGYINDPLPKKVMRDGKVVAEVARDGTWLARLYELPMDWDRTLNQNTSSPSEAMEK
ncbi:MAG: hypothetical protein U1D30_08605 [Planctomycetota bacterium]